MVDQEQLPTDPLLTRREAATILGCSLRTISRRINDGSLSVAYRANGQRAILRSSVLALADRPTPATPEPDVAQPSATNGWTPEAVRVAVAYATLAQAVQGHLDAGWLARKSTREQLRDALERVSADVAVVPLHPTQLLVDVIPEDEKAAAAAELDPARAPQQP
jgi:hypothetical protein